MSLDKLSVLPQQQNEILLVAYSLQWKDYSNSEYVLATATDF